MNSLQTRAPDTPSAIERVIQRERVWMALGLAATTALGWVDLARSAASIHAMSIEAQRHAAIGTADLQVWGASDWLGLFAMWSVMMVAMMLPSAAPVIRLILAVYRRRRHDPRARLVAVTFVAGYLLAWTAFSAAAASAQLALHRAALLTDDMSLASATMSGVILLMAGAYEWLPIKNMCLRHCQLPLGFLTRYWREGVGGGFVLGVRYGGFCVGCCWLLMTLLFVLGVMNLLWVAVLAALVMLERLTPHGLVLGRFAGVVIAGWGVYLLTI
jgi:predicted metal-binding membrane protein